MGGGTTTVAAPWQLFVMGFLMVMTPEISLAEDPPHVVEVALPDMSDDVREPASFLDGPCLHVTLRDDDWSLQVEDATDDNDGHRGKLIRKIRKRFNNETNRIKMAHEELNVTHFVRLIASRSTRRFLKIKAFARVFEQYDGLSRYVCRNARGLLRAAKGRNLTREEIRELEDELDEDVTAALMESDEEVRRNKSNGSDVQMQTPMIRKLLRRAVLALFVGPRKLDGKKYVLSKYIDKLAELGLLGNLGGGRREGQEGERKPRDREEETVTPRAGRQPWSGFGGTGSGLTGSRGREDFDFSSHFGERDEMDETYLCDIFGSKDWNKTLRGDEFPDDELVREHFNLEAYLFHLTSVYLDKPASCARNVTHLIAERANKSKSFRYRYHAMMRNWTFGGDAFNWSRSCKNGTFRDRFWCRYRHHVMMRNRTFGMGDFDWANRGRDAFNWTFGMGDFDWANRGRDAFNWSRGCANGTSRRGEFFGSDIWTGGLPGWTAGSQRTPVDNPLEELDEANEEEGGWRERLDMDEEKMRGRPNINPMVTLVKLLKIIDSWGEAGFLTNGTYFDATCRPKGEGLTGCNICPTDMAKRNLKGLIPELDSLIDDLYENIGGGVADWRMMWQRNESMTGGDGNGEGQRRGADEGDGGEDEDERPNLRQNREVFKFPALRLMERESVHGKQDCHSFNLDFKIQTREVRDAPIGGDRADGAPSDGVDVQEISYDDFNAWLEEHSALPDMPFILQDNDAALRRLVQKGDLTITSKTVSPNGLQLTVGVSLCGGKSRRLNLCLSLDGRSAVRTDDAPEGKCVTYTVWKPAPKLLSARFSDNSDSLVVIFNNDVNIGQLRGCSNIFDEATVALFGGRANCRWKKAKELIVKLTSSTTLAIGDSITLKPDSIKALREEYSRTASGSVNVATPNSPTAPTAVITDLSTGTACGKMRLSGLKSKGGGARGLTYTWSLTNPSPTEAIQQAVDEANAEGNGLLELNLDELTPDQDYTWELTVQTVAQQTHTVEFSKRREAESKPRLKIKRRGDFGDSVEVDKRIRLEGHLSFSVPKNCRSLDSSKVRYSWSLEGVTPTRTISRDKRMLNIPANALPGGATVTVTLTATAGSMTVEEQITFDTVAAPLVAKIKGGDYVTIGRASAALTLDCSRSKDPNYSGDGPDTGLTITWSCIQETDHQACETTSGSAIPASDQENEKVLTLSPSILTAGKTYSFTCTVGKDGLDSAVDAVKVEVTEEAAPTISLSLNHDDNDVYKPGQSVEVKGISDSSDIEWEDVGGMLAGFGEEEFTLFLGSDSASRRRRTEKSYRIETTQRGNLFHSVLTIDSSQLQFGTEYEIGLKATNGDQTSRSTITFRILNKITGCQFEYGGNDVYSDRGTSVTYTVHDCSNDDDVSLSYQPFIRYTVSKNGKTKSKERLLGTSSEEPLVEVDHIPLRADPDDVTDFVVGMKVCYGDNICTDFTTEVTYEHEALTQEEETETLERIATKKDEGDIIGALMDANNLQYEISGQSASQSAAVRRKRNADDCGVDRSLMGDQLELLSVIGADTSLFDSDLLGVKLVTDLATEIPVCGMTLDDRVGTMTSLGPILDSYHAINGRIPADSLDDARQQLEESRRGIERGSSEELDNLFKENMKHLAKVMSINLAIGESMVSIGSDMSISTMASLHSVPFSVQLDDEGDDIITFIGGSDLQERYNIDWTGCGCDTCVGSVVKIALYRGSDYDVDAATHHSPIIDLQILNPCGGEPLVVDSLVDPARFVSTVDAWDSTRHEPLCMFLNESTAEWSTNGVNTLFNGSEVTCETRHTTEFVIDLEYVAGSTTSADEMTTQHDMNIPGTFRGLVKLGIGVIVGIVAACLIVLIIVVILVAVVIKNLNKRMTKVEPVVKA